MDNSFKKIKRLVEYFSKKFIKNEEWEDLAQRIYVRIWKFKYFDFNKASSGIGYIARQEFLMMRRDNKMKDCIFEIQEREHNEEKLFINNKVFNSIHQKTLVYYMETYPYETNEFWAKKMGISESRVKQIRRELQLILRQ